MTAKYKWVQENPSLRAGTLAYPSEATGCVVACSRPLRKSRQERGTQNLEFSSVKVRATRRKSYTFYSLAGGEPATDETFRAYLIEFAPRFRKVDVPNDTTRRTTSTLRLRGRVNFLTCPAPGDNWQF